MCFYLENCSLEIFCVGTICGVYYVQLERSKAGQKNSIFICAIEFKPNNYPCGLCEQQVSNLGFMEVSSLV